MSQEPTNPTESSSSGEVEQKQTSSSSSGLASVKVESTGPGRAKVTVNDKDVSSFVTGLSVDMAVGEVTKFVLEGNSLETVVEGPGVVIVPVRPLPVSLVIRGLDPKELEAAALERMQWGEDRSLAECMLDVLSEAMEEFDASQS